MLNLRAALLILLLVFAAILLLVELYTPPSTPSQPAEILEDLDTVLTTPLWMTLKVGALLLAIGLVILGADSIYKLISIARRTIQLSVVPFKNGSGDTSLDGAGFRELTLEKVRRRAAKSRGALAQAIAEQTEGEQTPRPLPSEIMAERSPSDPIAEPVPHDLDENLRDLTSSLAALAPDQMSVLVPILNLILPHRGIRATSTLQCIDTASGGLGISVEISTMKIDGDKPQVCTIWEPKEKEASTNEQGSTSNETLQLAKRYYNLLEVVATWIAIRYEVRRLFVGPARRYSEKESNYAKAQIHNFFARYCRDLAAKENNTGFYDIAIAEYVKAVEHHPQWFHPYEGLGVTFSYRGDQQLSIENYGKAIELIDQIQGIDTTSRYRLKMSPKIGRATSQLLTHDPTLIGAARGTIANIEERVPYDTSSEETRLSITATYYNLAAWYTQYFDVLRKQQEGQEQEGQDVEAAREKALSYLASSLRESRSLQAVSTNLWDYVDYDPEFEVIRSDIENLKREIAQERP